ncbi:hypothetical protein M569_03756, partial [Genlisea aurea]
LHHHHHHQQLQYSGDQSTGERFPQWSSQETRDFLMIRAEHEPDFMKTKHNKLLWELISSRMKEKGYFRTPDQCKCKWKNLVTRFKGCDGLEGQQVQFPFYNEVQAILGSRIMWSESSTKKKLSSSSSSSDEDTPSNSIRQRKKKKKKTQAQQSSNEVAAMIKDTMEGLMKQQMQMEMQWMKALEERRAMEMEWRKKMEDLERERAAMERTWREKEEQRRIREEARAERRDALITILLNNLAR